MKPFLFALICVCATSLAQSEPRLVVATDLWPPDFTLRSGEGLYQKILARVYPDHCIVYVYTSYARSKDRVLKGKADMWLASYAQEEAEALYPNLPYDADILSLIRRPSTRWRTPDDLQGQQVAWIQAYGLDRYLPEYELQFYEVPTIGDGLRMLLAGRVNYYLDDLWHLRDYLQRHPHLAQEIKQDNLGLLPLYPGFADTARSRELITLWDKGLAALQQTGELEAIYTAFNQEYIAAACHNGTLPENKKNWSGLPCLTIPPSSPLKSR